MLDYRAAWAVRWAQDSMSPPSIASASSSGNASGVQANAGMPRAARAAALFGVEGRRALVGQGQQGHDLHARRVHGGHPGEHLLLDAALVQVGDQYEDRSLAAG